MAAATVGGQVGVPTPYLFASFVVGIVYALLGRVPLLPPGPANLAAQAVIGVTVGTYLQRSTLGAVGTHWVSVVGVCLATLALSVGAGLLLPRVAPIDQATASFGMIAGGAAGIIAISRELGADERLVAVLQYLRVLIIVAITPVVATVVFGISKGVPHAGAQHSLAGGIAFAVVCGAVGIVVARLLRLPAGAILGPMLVAGCFALGGAGFAAPPPSLVTNAAFAIIGLEVGLRFTPASIREARQVLPAALAMTVAMIGISALLGVLLASTAGVSEVDGYLATTPGGLSAVLALSVGSRTNTTFIVSVQVIRTVVMLLAAPPLARWIGRRRRLVVGAT